jgi:uncharacterized membrane protein YbaN (DUF454 family)
MKLPGWLTNPERPGTVWRAAAGWMLVCVGVLGIVLPVIPGVPLLIAGLVILSARYRWASDCLQWVKQQARKVAASSSATK